MKHGIQGPGCETDFFCLFSLPNDKKNKLKSFTSKQKKVHQVFQAFLMFSGHNCSFRKQNTFTKLWLTEGLSIPKK